ncbi:MAG: relaxase domain-containing protein [Acidimicrobiales bacterium]|jgi:hypothetical protein
MLRLLVRRSNDVTYFTNDAARELDTVRDGGPGWWLRGSGDVRDPRDVERVLSSTERSSVQGYDVIVAAPRPISILLATDPEQGSGVVAAHRVSVAATMRYLEERALVVRDRRGGVDREEAATWSRIVSFTHGLNRHGEPHLHDHVLVGARPDRAHTVLDSRALFAHVNAADALYRSSLRHELAQRTTWTAWRSFNGVDHVEGQDEGYRALWGGHHDGRGEKLRWQRGETLEHWRRDLARFAPEGALTSPPRPRGRLDEHVFSGALEGRVDVTRRDVVRAWADAATFGQSAQELDAAIDRFYPALQTSRGVREATIPLAQARMIAQVRDRGPRPLALDDLVHWTQRPRERSGTWSERSR